VRPRALAPDHAQLAAATSVKFSLVRCHSRVKRGERRLLRFGLAFQGCVYHPEQHDEAVSVTVSAKMVLPPEWTRKATVAVTLGLPASRRGERFFGMRCHAIAADRLHQHFRSLPRRASVRPPIGWAQLGGTIRRCSRRLGCSSMPRQH
jgi:hypothetical protein